MPGQMTASHELLDVVLDRVAVHPSTLTYPFVHPFPSNQISDSRSLTMAEQIAVPLKRDAPEYAGFRPRRGYIKVAHKAAITAAIWRVLVVVSV